MVGLYIRLELGEFLVCILPSLVGGLYRSTLLIRGQVVALNWVANCPNPPYLEISRYYTTLTLADLKYF